MTVPGWVDSEGLTRRDFGTVGIGWKGRDSFVEMTFQIRAGRTPEISKESGDWLFVDVGFSSKKKSTGILKGDGQPEEVTFSKLVEEVVCETRKNAGRPLNLLLEAPLSAAFNKDGNPTGRLIERKDSRHRYWYENSAPALIVATGHLLRAVVDSGIRREVRLFEGFVSFKEPGKRSSHIDDVLNLRQAVWNPTPTSIVQPSALKRDASDTLEWALKFAGIDYGVPPVVVA